MGLPSPTCYKASPLFSFLSKPFLPLLVYILVTYYNFVEMNIRSAAALLAVLFVVANQAIYSNAQTCNSYTFSSNRLFSACNDLPVLNSFLHWNYIPANRTVHLAYRHTGVSATRWVAWAINPTSTGMVGSQALVAYQGTDGRMRAYTSPITAYGTGLQPGNLSFPVPAITAEFANNEITIYATVVLPEGSTSTSVNQVWQDGPLNAGSPGIHDRTGPNMQSMGTVDFISGETTLTGGGNSRMRRRNVHGVLNAVSWGVLMPLGAIIARYLKVAKSTGPAWFYLHMACQTSAYAVGVAGWGTGLKLGSDSAGIQYNPHRNIGIALFVLGTLQVFALLLRPKPDHKFRFYWRIYHMMTGYVVIILSIVNIYKGFDILDPDRKWRRIYTGIIIALGAIAVVLELFTWMVVIKRKRSEEKSHHGGGHAATNGMNGHGAKNQQGV